MKISNLYRTCRPGCSFTIQWNVRERTKIRHSAPAPAGFTDKLPFQAISLRNIPLMNEMALLDPSFYYPNQPNEKDFHPNVLCISRLSHCTCTGKPSHQLPGTDQPGHRAA